jgi:hypothetical protein
MESIEELERFGCFRVRFEVLRVVLMMVQVFGM